jgi:hypothetical protein
MLDKYQYGRGKSQLLGEKPRTLKKFIKNPQKTIKYATVSSDHFSHGEIERNSPESSSGLYDLCLF